MGSFLALVIIVLEALLALSIFRIDFAVCDGEIYDGHP